MTSVRATALLSPDHSSAAEAGLVRIVSESAFVALAEADADLKAAAELFDFTGQRNRFFVRIVGGRREAWLGLGSGVLTPLMGRSLAGRLPAGPWRIEEEALGALSPDDRARFAAAFLIGLYQFDAFKSEKAKPGPSLVIDPEVHAFAQRRAEAADLARDLVNRPAEDLGPAELEQAARALAERFGADIAVIAGEDLLTRNYPAVHAVGRAAAQGREPRLIELSWRGSAAPQGAKRLVLIGKGVTFDTGGLDLKPSSAMRLMKKDMGGAAHALALAGLVMSADIPVDLTLLIPAVENAVSGGAMRPGDVIRTRRGLTVEIGNTDAEGRLILADALERARELEPDLTLDLATLTGAARVALGPEIIPFYTDDEDLAAALAEASRIEEDPLWRMPLPAAYEESLDSDIADLKNDPDAWAQAGSVTAALFLRRFAPGGAWIHFDVFAWNPRKTPGRPAGGEAQTLRALDLLLRQRYATSGEAA